jgi:hypothetical protein
VANEALVVNDADVANELEIDCDAEEANEAVPNKLPVIEPVTFIDPVILNEPDKEISYASIPVKASMDWEICPGRMVPSEDIPVLDNCCAIFYYKYCKFKSIAYGILIMRRL